MRLRSSQCSDKSVLFLFYFILCDPLTVIQCSYNRSDNYEFNSQSVEWDKNVSRSIKVNYVQLPLSLYLLNGLHIKGRIWDHECENERALFPHWVNPQLLKRGQQFALEKVAGSFLSSLYGLTMLFAFPQISEVLLFTANSHTRKQASRRYAATLVQVFLWMRKSLLKKPFPLRSLANVHKIHANVAMQARQSLADGTFYLTLENIKRKGVYYHGRKKISRWNAFFADLDNSAIPWERRVAPAQLFQNMTTPISQFSLAMTQWAFFGILVTRPEAALIFNPNKRDMEAWIHFWAVIGFAMGLQDEYNIALGLHLGNKDFWGIKNFMEEVLHVYFIPMLFQLRYNENALILADAYLEGISDLLSDFRVDSEFLLRGVLRDILKIPIPHLNKRRTFQARQLDWLSKTGSRVPSKIFPMWDKVFSPIAIQYHKRIGWKYFGKLYQNDETISEFCFTDPNLTVW